MHRYTLVVCCLVALSMIYGNSGVTAELSNVVGWGRPSGTRETPDLQSLSQDRAEKVTTALKRKVRRIRAKDVPAYAVFAAIAEKAGIPVGLELLPSDVKDKLISLDIAGGTISGALDQVYFADQRYYYNLGLNYFPRAYPNAGATEVGRKAPLRAPTDYVFLAEIGRFKVERQSPTRAIEQLLGEEVPAAKRPILPVEVSSVGGPPANTEMTFVREKVSVRSAINLIALASGKNWVARTSNGSLQVRLFDKASLVFPEAANIEIELE